MKLVLELSIIEYCKSKQLSEGLIDKVVGHVFDILHKSNDKRTAAALKSIAKSGPAGKEAVKNAIELTQTVQRAGNAAAQNRADIRKKYNLKYA
jgi:hypothetical protein